jgi:hypothetical protein
MERSSRNPERKYSKLNVELTHLFDRTYLDYYYNDIPVEEAFKKLLKEILSSHEGREFLKETIKEINEEVKNGQ